MISIDNSKCVQCKLCENDCPSLAININDYSVAEQCIKCGHCAAICPQNAISAYNEIPASKEIHSISDSEFEVLVNNNRSIRKYKQQEIQDDILNKLTEIMKLYPSASNRRDVQITIVKGHNIVEKLNNDVAKVLLKYFTNLAKPVTRTLLSLVIGRKDAKKLKYYRDSFSKKKNLRPDFICFSAPAVIIFHAPKSMIGMSSADSYIWATQTTNYALTFGLATCFNGFIEKAFNKKGFLKEKYGVPVNHKVHASLIIGYPKVNYKNKINRHSPQIHIKTN